jgi:hypothetical protein
MTPATDSANLDAGTGLGVIVEGKKKDKEKTERQSSEGGSRL